jgi:hypothetical protein
MKNNDEVFASLVNQITDEYIVLLDKENDNYSVFVGNMIVFIHERIEAMVVLIKNNLYWDADIMLRPIAEASIKILYVAHCDDKDNKVKEFWTDLSEINQLRQSKQAEDIHRILNIDSGNLLNLILPDIEKLRLLNKWNKKTKQKISQSWSYKSMIQSLSKSMENEGILCLHKLFTQSSHLLHADDMALGVIRDRKGRSIADQKKATNNHKKRLYSDSLTLYLLTIIEVYKVYGREKSFNLKKIIATYKEFSSQHED